jgi:hypothetical protein
MEKAQEEKEQWQIAVKQDVWNGATESEANEKILCREMKKHSLRRAPLLDSGFLEKGGLRSSIPRVDTACISILIPTYKEN